MKKVLGCLMVLGILINPGSVYAKIYTWVDENGTKHFSNSAPPEDVEGKNLSVQEEIPVDSKENDTQKTRANFGSGDSMKSVKSESGNKELSPDEIKKIDQEVRATWSGLKNALTKGDINKAVEYHTPSSREEYRKIYTELSKPKK